MTGDKKNALAELADEIQGIVTFIYYGSGECGAVEARKIAKAQRIVAELAKVEKPIDRRTVGMTHLADMLDADKNRAVEIVRNCRVIAEEGEK